jgi:hypothetical protein
MRKVLVVMLMLISLGMIGVSSANNPTAKGSADAFSHATAITNSKYDPFSIAWTSSWTINNAKVDPVSISDSSGQAYAWIDCFALGDAYSNAFAYSQGPNMAETSTFVQNLAFVNDYKASATAEAHAEGTAY